MVQFVYSVMLYTSAAALAQDVKPLEGSGHHVVPCGAQLVDLNHYTCFDNRIACPAPKTQLCGIAACYNPAEYHCKQGQLMQGKETDAKHLGLSGLSESGLSSQEHYGIVVPGPGAYQQLLSDLGKDGIHIKQIDEIRTVLNANGFSLTTQETAVILRNTHGAEAGLEKFATTLSNEEAENLEKSMPSIQVILGGVATKTGPLKPVPGPGMSDATNAGKSGTSAGTTAATGGTSDNSGTSSTTTTTTVPTGQAGQLVGSALVLALSTLLGSSIVFFF